MNEAIWVREDGLVEARFHDPGNAGEKSKRQDQDQRNFCPKIELKLPDERSRKQSEQEVCQDVDDYYQSA